MPNIDLHCHSQASDGLLTAEAVVKRAAANGVEMIALTDHDTLEGLPEARKTAELHAMRLINGVEISIEWGGIQVHIVGLNFNEQNQTLVDGLQWIRSGRVDRAKKMSAELEKIGISGCFDGAMRHAKNPALISRSHFARYLVEIGVCKDVRSVFDAYIVPGRPGYVDHRWASLEQAILWVTGAGGVAVLAHPARYKLSRTEMRKFLSEFKDFGGKAIEVTSGSQSLDSANLYATLTREYGLMASCGSDFHGPAESMVDLGQFAALPIGLTPVWEAF